MNQFDYFISDDAPRIEKIALALKMLCVARDLLREAAAPKTLERVRLAISSAKGAVRNASYDASRAERRAA